MTWTVVAARRAERDIRSIAGPDLLRIRRALEEMSSDPLAGDVRKLKGLDGAFRPG